MLCIKTLASFLLIGALGACQSGPQEPLQAVAPSSLQMDLTDMRGGSHPVDQVLASGQPVVLVFWQTWCSSCVEEAPHLAEASRELEGELQFLGIVSGPDKSVDEARIDEMVESLEISYPQVRDRDSALARAFGVEATPTIIVLGPQRKILYRGHRAPADWLALTATP